MDQRESTEVNGVQILANFNFKSVATAPTPPNGTPLSNFCSAILAVSWVPDEMWPIQITRGPPWTHMDHIPHKITFHITFSSTLH